MAGNVDTMKLEARETQICEVDETGETVQRLCEICCPECSDVESRASDWGMTLAEEIERRYNAFPQMRELLAQATDMLMLTPDPARWIAWHEQAARILNTTERPELWNPNPGKVAES